MLNFIKNKKITTNPFLLFSPFLLLYIILVLLFPTHGVTGDESKYLNLAGNLTHGFYSAPAPNIYLGEGPGYPIILMPFIALNLPLLCITLLNAVLYYLSIVLLYKALQTVISNNKIIITICLFWGFYYNLYEFVPIIFTETVTVFLIALILYYLMKAFETEQTKGKIKYIVIAGIAIGYLALTKLIFAYVLLVLLFGAVLLWFINKKSANYRKSVFVLLVSFATISPYLIYTYHLTGRFFYLGTSGGVNMYWMSTPYEGEYGSWFSELKQEGNIDNNVQDIQNPKHENQLLSKTREFNIPGLYDSLKAKHQKNFDEIYNYTGVERDDAFKRIAIQNIKSNPIKFLKNCFANVGRILFNYPYSYQLQRPATLIRFPLSGIILVLMLYSFIPTIINWRKILFPIRFILFFVFVYLGGSVLGSAESRMFTMIVPMLLLWIAYILNKTVKVNLHISETTAK